MGDERLQTISLRIPEETYTQLKKYAGEHGESVSDVVRGLIDGLLSGAQTPGPPTEVTITPEILELLARIIHEFPLSGGFDH